MPSEVVIPKMIASPKYHLYSQAQTREISDTKIGGRIEISGLQKRRCRGNSVQILYMKAYQRENVTYCSH